MLISPHHVPKIHTNLQRGSYALYRYKLIRIFSTSPDKLENEALHTERRDPAQTNESDALIAVKALIQRLTVVIRHISDLQTRGVTSVNPWD